MRKVKLYIAMSLDGKIADRQGAVDWLEQVPNPQNTDYGYSDFLRTIDTTIMGNDTYKEVLKLSPVFPYTEKTNYVLTRDSSLKDNDQVKYISEDPIDFIRNLKNTPGKDLWLIGGGQVNTLLHTANLIDEYLVYLMPVVVGAGIPLFADSPARQFLDLVRTETYSSGVTCLHYKLSKK